MEDLQIFSKWLCKFHSKYRSWSLGIGWCRNIFFSGCYFLWEDGFHNNLLLTSSWKSCRDTCTRSFACVSMVILSHEGRLFFSFYFLVEGMIECGTANFLHLSIPFLLFALKLDRRPMPWILVDLLKWSVNVIPILNKSCCLPFRIELDRIFNDCDYLDLDWFLSINWGLWLKTV